MDANGREFLWWVRSGRFARARARERHDGGQAGKVAAPLFHSQQGLVATRLEHKVLFAGGGTGGHLMPAINIALALARRDANTEALFIGKKGGMEAAIVRRFGFQIREIDVVALKRNPPGILRFILNWNKGLKQALEILKDFHPDVVMGTGGYVSAPVVRAVAEFDHAGGHFPGPLESER